MDEDHSGEVDAGEFCEHLTSIGLTDRNLGMRLFAAIDVDNGTLSINEVYTFLNKLEEGSREQVESVFNIFAGGSDKTSFNRAECKRLMVTLVGDKNAETMTKRVPRIRSCAAYAHEDEFVNNMTFDDSNTEKIVVQLAQGVSRQSAMSRSWFELFIERARGTMQSSARISLIRLQSHVKRGEREKEMFQAIPTD